MNTPMTDTSQIADNVDELRHQLANTIEEARARTMQLIAPLSEEDLFRQHDKLMSPIIWDIGHIGNFEELWGVRTFRGDITLHPEYDPMYDAFRNPRSI